MTQFVQVGQDFRDGPVKARWNLFAQLDVFVEVAGHFRTLDDRDAVFAGDSFDALGDQPQSLKYRRDNRIDNFRFHSDYRVDRILFREIIGTVTDAMYAKPHARLRL